MALKIVRNDIINMDCDAIVNTANEYVAVGPGCDQKIYDAAGFWKLIAYRETHIGEVPEGEVFITPGFDLPAKYIIHAVSPLFIDGNEGEEEKLRSCYRKSLQLALENDIHSIAFPLIATGGYGYPKEEGMRIAVDEINAFLLKYEMLIYLVVYDEESTELGRKISPLLKEFIDDNYEPIESCCDEHDFDFFDEECIPNDSVSMASSDCVELRSIDISDLCSKVSVEKTVSQEEKTEQFYKLMDQMKDNLQFRKQATFTEYLLYLIKEKGMTNAEVYKRAIVDKKTFSKIKNHSDYHPQKMTAMCLCIGAKLNLDQTKDLLSRAGYALSPCDMTDLIFTFFIENEIYDMIELDIQLEEHGLKCLIS